MSVKGDQYFQIRAPQTLNACTGDFPSSLGVKTLCFQHRGGVPSLVRELRSHMPLGQAKSKKKKKNQTYAQISRPLLKCRFFFIELEWGLEVFLISSPVRPSSQFQVLSSKGLPCIEPQTKLRFHHTFEE